MDSELVNAVLSGDKAAFATLVKRYEPFVRTAAMTILLIVVRSFLNLGPYYYLGKVGLPIY